MTNEELQSRLGAAPAEILSTEEVDGGTLAHMFDGTSYLVADDGAITWLRDQPGHPSATQEAPEEELVEDAAEAVEVEEPTDDAEGVEAIPLKKGAS